MLLLSFLSDYREFLSDPAYLIRMGGLLLLLVIIYMETGFLIGMFLPGGDYTLFTAGFLCGSLILDVHYFILFPLLALAAFLGDITGYLQGMWLGPRLFTKEESRFFKPSYLHKSHDFYVKYGLVAFVTGKFLPVIRAIIPMLAGASAFGRKKFVAIALLGSVVWTGSLTAFGYLVGHLFPGLIHYKLYVMIGFIVLASSPVIRIWFKKKKTSNGNE